MLTFLEVTRLELANIPANLSVFLLTLLKNKKNKNTCKPEFKKSLLILKSIFLFSDHTFPGQGGSSFALNLFFSTKGGNQYSDSRDPI